MDTSRTLRAIFAAILESYALLGAGVLQGWH